MNVEQYLLLMNSKTLTDEEKKLVVLPGYSYQPISLFHFTMPEMPTVNQQMRSYLKKEKKDFALLLEKGISWEEVFQKRLECYDVIFKEYLKNR